MSLFSRDYLTLGKRWLLTEKLFERNQGHIYVVGGSGTGKTSEVYNLILQRIKKGEGVGIIDSHTDLTKKLEKAIFNMLSQEEKRKRVTILDPTRGYFGFNFLEPQGEIYPMVMDLIQNFRAIWSDSWGSRMEDILRHAFLVMAEKGLTFCEIPKFLTNERVRRDLIKDLDNESAKEYWTERFGKLPDREKATWIESSQNRISKFLGPRMRKVVCQKSTTVDFRHILDNPDGSVLIISLPRSKLKMNVFLLGALLINKIEQAALSRTDLPPSQRLPWNFVVDEFQNFGTSSLNFEEILSEARKYGLFLTLAHQNLDQIDRDLLSSILGNTTCQIIFRTSRKDAEVLAKEIFDVDIDDLEWERKNGETRLNLPERWEDHLNKLTNLDHREAYVAKKEGTQTNRIRTLDMETYEADPQELERQAEWIMKPYCKSEEEIKKEQEELNKELEPKKPTYKVPTND